MSRIAPFYANVINMTSVMHSIVAVVVIIMTTPPRWPSGKASASRAEGPGFESRLRRDFFGVESYQ